MSDTIPGYESSKQAVDLLDQAINEMARNGVAPDELVKAKKAHILASDVVSGFEWRHNGLLSSPDLRVVEAWTDEFTSATHHFRTPIPLEEVPSGPIELVKSADEFTVTTTGSYCEEFNSYDSAVAHATKLAENHENEINHHPPSVIVSLDDIPEEQLNEKTRTEYLLYP